MAGIPLYSSSPPAAAWSTQYSLSNSSSTSTDVDINLRPVHHHSPASRPVVGGRSGLFSSKRPPSQSPCSVSDGLDSSFAFASGIARSSSQDNLSRMVRNSSQDSLSHHGGTWECGYSRGGSASMPIGPSFMLKERSPVSVLHGPSPRNSLQNSSKHSLIGLDTVLTAPGLPPLDPHLDRHPQKKNTLFAGFAVDRAKFSLLSTSAIRQQAQSKTQTSAAKTIHTCECHDLFDEMVPYVTSWTWQKETVDSMCAAVMKGEEPSSSVMILQHPPVYTMGTRSSDSYLRFDKENPPFELHRTERGGEVTYHGPGQLVMYPILNLRQHKMDLHWYLRTLEEVVIRTLWSACGLRASRVDGLTGVWVGEAKVAAIGVRVSRWITYHGLALNVTTDLAPFQNIVPCGISDRQVGSIQQLLKADKYHEDQVNGSLTSNKMFSSPDGLGNGSYNTGVTSDVSKVAGKTVWDDATLLSHVHSTLLTEFAEVFQLQLVPPIRDSQETLSVLSSSQ